MTRSKNINSRIRKRKRLMCFERQNGKCYYCGQQLQLTHPKKKKYATIEHLKERSRGGTWRNDNIAVACLPCNNKQVKINEAFYIVDNGIIDIVGALTFTTREPLHV